MPSSIARTTGVASRAVVMGLDGPGQKRKWLSSSTVPVIDPESGATSTISTFSDITREFLARQEIAALQTRLQALFDSAPDAIITIDATQHLVAVNQVALHLFGYHEEDLLGKRLSTLLPPHVREHHTEWVHNFAKETTTARRMGQGRVVTGVRRDGGEFPLEISLSRIELPNERFYMAICRDISERQATDSRVRQLSLAVEQSPNGIVITDLLGRIEYVNSAFCGMCEYGQNELVGATFDLVKSGKTPKATIERLWRCLNEGQVWKGEFINRARSGREYLDFSIIAPMRDSDGRITKYIAIAEDITERKRIGHELDRHRAQLEEMVAERTSELMMAKLAAETAASAKGQFLANMSHEIRTPLNAVIGFAHLMAREIDTPRQREQLGRIEGAARHLVGIVNEILDFSKLEAGKVEPEPHVFVLSELMRFAYDLTISRLEGKDVAVEVEIDPALPPELTGDRMRLGQILGNFAGNAAKFTARGHIKIAVSLQAHEGSLWRLRFSVSDWHRIDRRAACPPVPTLRAGGYVDYPALRWHRPGTGGQSQSGHRAWRTCRRR